VADKKKPDIYFPNRLNYRVGNISDIHKKSYLVEFLNKDNTVEEAFTFSVPPESEELSYSQRKTETKTFGGLHVDDYGIDAVKIVLSGSTVNRELKRIYRPGMDDEWLTGEEEIYRLRDLLARYKTGAENIAKHIMLYDLSKIYVSATGVRPEDRHKTGFIKNYWRVFPGDFKIRRSNDRPFTYKYTIEFTGIAQEADQIAGHDKPPELSQGKADALRALMENFLAALDFIDGLNGTINNALAYIDKASRLISTLGDIMNYASSATTGAADSAGAALSGFTDAVANFVTGANSIIALPRAVQLSAVNIGAEVFNAANALARSVADVCDECRKMFDPESGYWDIPAETLRRFSVTAAEFKDSIAVICDEAENAANELAAAAKSAEIPDVTEGDADPKTGRRAFFLFYGYFIVYLKETDTLESLAARYMGNPDMALYIAAFNGIASLDELKPGDPVKIPITRKSGKNTGNRIFARPGDRENYGRDIALDDDGFVKVSASGDFELTGGADNLSQAVLLRLRESVDKRIRLNSYGIRNNINDSTAGVAYILSSIDLTVRSDPRVKSVDSIRFSGAGDGLKVDVDYSDINGGAGSAKGRA
jgi:hypothetical protein